MLCFNIFFLQKKLKRFNFTDATQKKKDQNCYVGKHEDKMNSIDYNKINNDYYSLRYLRCYCYALHAC